MNKCCNNCVFPYFREGKRHIACWHHPDYDQTDHAYTSDNPNKTKCVNFISFEDKKCKICKYYNEVDGECQHKSHAKIIETFDTITINRKYIIDEDNDCCDHFVIDEMYSDNK